ncbi:MAG: YdbL family protein [Candidatus Methylomirabilales bacterium]
MRRKLACLAVFFLVSCVTVNIYFPAAAIQRAADEIVDDVRKTPEAPSGPAPATPKDRSSLLPPFRAAVLGPAVAEAGGMDLNVSTPAIRNLKAAMAGRFPQLQPLYGKGAIGETNTGLLAVRDTAALSLKEKADVNRLVEQENADRQALYAEIVRANNLDPRNLGEVQRLFANSWRDKSAPGWWIQLDTGQWARK